MAGARKEGGGVEGDTPSSLSMYISSCPSCSSLFCNFIVEDGGVVCEEVMGNGISRWLYSCGLLSMILILLLEEEEEVAALSLSICIFRSILLFTSAWRNACLMSLADSDDDDDDDLPEGGLMDDDNDEEIIWLDDEDDDGDCFLLPDGED